MGGRDEDLRRAADLFAARFSSLARVLAWAPGRVNLIGDHVDYQGGLVLPMAIGLGCACAVGPGIPGRLRVVSDGFGELIDCDAAEAMTPGGGVAVGHWASYAAGVAAEVARAGGRAGVGIDVALAASVPAGSGLSSSAAVEVAVASAVAGLWGIALEPLEVARLCRRAEHLFAGTPCGLMDQAAAVLGRAGHAVLFDCRDESAAWVPIPDTARWFVVDTGVRHRLADGAYAGRRSAAERAAGALGAVSLREVTGAHLRARRKSLQPDEADAAAHIVSEIGRVSEAANALRAEDLGAFGRLMDASHASLRDVYRVSCAELDLVVEVARRCPNVLGARMTGGGFGGCAVVLVEREGAAGFAGAFADEIARAGWAGPAMPAVRAVFASGGAGVAGTGAGR